MRDDYDIGPGSVATGGGGAPTLDEIYEASQEATRLNATRGSRLLSLERAYDEASDTIRAATMQQLANPVRSPVGPSTMQAPGVDGGEDPHLAWDRQVGELRQRFPDKAPFFKTSDEIVAAAARMRREAEEHSADIEARRPGFFSDPRATGAMLAGSFAGMLRDPGQAIEVAATGWIGFGKTLLWNAVGNAAVNATSDALSQPLIQSWRKEAGLDYGLGHAASSVAMSAIFGGALDAGVRGAARGLGAGRARLRGDDISVREAILEGITPREQLERAARARPDGDVLRRAAGGDEGAQIEVARQMGLDKADPEVRGAIHAIEAERELQAATPRAAVAESDHLAATAQALRHALDGEAPPRAPELLREAAPDPEARARLDAAADPLEAARILKESPGALADHTMADSDFMRVASGLARVSDELAAHVEAGRVRPDLAGIVGHLVERDGDQLRLAEALHRAEPASEAEARKLLSEALRTPRDAETMTALAVPESPARVLAAERGEALARAMPDLLADARLKGVLGDDGAAAIASLAAIRGPVSDALTKAAEAIAAGADRKATSRALASRIAGLVDERGLAHLAEGDGRVLAHNGVDDPTGADAKLQIERLQRTVEWGEAGNDAGEATLFSLPRLPSEITGAQAIDELRRVFGFNRSIRLGQNMDDRVAVATLRVAHLIADVTGIEPRRVGQIVNSRLRLEKDVDNFAGSFLGRGKWRGGTLTIAHGAQGSTIVHEIGHAIDAAARGRRLFGGFATEARSRLDRLLLVANLIPGVNIVSLPVHILIDRFERSGRWLGRKMRRQFPWMTDGVAAGFADVARVLDDGNDAGPPKRRKAVKEKEDARSIAWKEWEAAIARGEAAWRDYEKAWLNASIERRGYTDEMKLASDAHEAALKHSTALAEKWRSLDAALNEETGKRTLYEASLDIDAGHHGAYFSRPAEMFARAFEVYVREKAASSGRYSDGDLDAILGREVGGQQYAKKGSRQHADLIRGFDAIFAGVRSNIAALAGGDGQMFSLRSGDYGLAPAASRDLPAIRAEVDKAAKALPADVRVRLEERLHFGDREIDGRYDIAERVVYASLASADPARIVRHETIHALKASGLLASGEYEILRRHAEAGDLRKAYNIDDRYEKAYGGKLEALRERAKAAKDADAETKAALQGDIARETDRVEGLLWEETVAEMFADHRAGKSFGGAIDRILKTISDFLERVRNGLSGRGFKTVEDVFGAIENGDVAGRKPVDPPTATGSRLAIEDAPTETTPRQAYDEAAGLMQQHEMVGWCK